MVADGKSKPAISFAGTFTSSAFSACFAEVCTIPLDTAKVRLQLQKQALGANAVTSDVGIAVANPTDIVKVRLQAEGKLPPGVPRRYSGSLNAYSTIVKQEGIAALWTSLGPNIARNAIINAAELASNDQVKSRMMGDSSYKSTLDCFLKTLKNDGPFAFYKVFIPNFGRLGSWNVIMFLTLEQHAEAEREAAHSNTLSLGSLPLPSPGSRRLHFLLFPLSGTQVAQLVVPIFPGFSVRGLEQLAVGSPLAVALPIAVVSPVAI
ncbi:Mitochondrial uncoupling protein [Arachis hypogaea]|nr:Mitochondrial uncoupling protein [Arachis hypogaea]